MALRSLTYTLVDLLQPTAAGSRQLLSGHQLASTTSGLPQITERLQSRWSLDSWLKSWQDSSWLAVPKKKVSLLTALKLSKTFGVESPSPADISSQTRHEKCWQASEIGSCCGSLQVSGACLLSFWFAASIKILSQNHQQCRECNKAFPVHQLARCKAENCPGRFTQAS